MQNHNAENYKKKNMDNTDSTKKSMVNQGAEYK
jgi:hypothetical protein